MDETVTSAAVKMQKAVDVVRQDLATIRTGRATPQLLEGLSVEAYGSWMKLIELAVIMAPDPRNLMVTPFDQANTPAICGAIEGSGMGFTPIVNENVIRVMVPPLSQERRGEFVKLASVKVEGVKVMVRQIRHDVMDDIRTSDLDEDTTKRLEKEIIGNLKKINY